MFKDLKKNMVSMSEKMGNLSTQVETYKKEPNRNSRKVEYPKWKIHQMSLTAN